MYKEMQVFKPLEQYIGHKVFFEKTDSISFTFENFQMDIESYENVLVVSDGNNSCCRLFIPTFGLDGINVTGSDLYDSIIEIDSTHHNWLISCDEQRPVFPHCFKCKKEIKLPRESIYGIHGIPEFSSHYENQDNELHSLNFCDNCLHDFVGEISNAFTKSPKNISIYC